MALTMDDVEARHDGGDDEDRNGQELDQQAMALDDQRRRDQHHVAGDVSGEQPEQGDEAQGIYEARGEAEDRHGGPRAKGVPLLHPGILSLPICMGRAYAAPTCPYLLRLPAFVAAPV